MSGSTSPSKYPYLVSVIIPIYNVSEYIESSLQSALNQTFASIEYVLVDDRGTDNSMEIVNAIISIHKRKNDIKVIQHDNNKGLSAARNTGMKHAQGKYLFFLDSDDEISIDCIQKHYDAIVRIDADFTVANIELIGSKSIHSNNHLSKDIESCPPLVSFCNKRWSVSAWNKLYNKYFIQKSSMEFIDGIIHEDVIWSFTLSRLAKKIAVVNEQTYKYKIRDNSITTKSNSKRKIECLLYILDEIHSQYSADQKNHVYQSEFVKFYDFWRFTTAIQLLIFHGKDDETLGYYHKIQSLNTFKDFSLYNITLLLPFMLFKSILKPLYSLYKGL